MKHSNQTIAKQAVLFDLDGTLVDTAGDLIDSLNLLLTQHQREPLPYQHLRPYASDGSRGLIKQAFNITEEAAQFSALRQQYLAIYHQMISETNKPPHLFNQVQTFLTQLEQNAVPWGIVTNKPRYLTELIISQSEPLAKNQVLVCGDDLRPKPYPDGLLLASRKLGLAAEDCIYVGDHERDIIAGKSAGMLSIAVAYGYSPEQDNIENWGADYIVQSIEEVMLFANGF